MQKNNTAEYRSFSNVSNQYFIPATSIKGEVRNVLEILSFSKMDVDHNALFAQREWNNPELYSIKGNQLHILCGWLKRVAMTMKSLIVENSSDQS